MTIGTDAGPESDGGAAGRPWHGAPCGLIRVDRAGRVTQANRRFLDRTGYSHSAVVGVKRWNQLLMPGSRFFFETQLGPVLVMDGSVDEVMLDLRDVNGVAVPSLMNAIRVVTEDGADDGLHLAFMTVLDRREYEDQLRVARQQAEQASQVSAHARQRLELLARANAALASSLDVEVALHRLAVVLTEQIADWCLIYAIESSRPPGLPQWSAVHVDPFRQRALEQVARLLPGSAAPASAVQRVLQGGAPVLMSATPDRLAAAIDDPVLLDLLTQVGAGSAAIVPSVTRGHPVAALVLVRGPQRAAFDADDLTDFTDLGARSGIVIDNLRRYNREHNDSMVLQQALLTAAPQPAGLDMVSRYLPAGDGAQVGGDWYDSFVQPDGASVLVIGDVVGHDIEAAAAMGQLRGVIRTVGHMIAGTPADTLARADQAARGLQVDVLATAIVARVEEPGPTGARTLRWSNAGHPPPVLIRRDGQAALLDSEPDTLLGALVNVRRHDHTVLIEPGDTLLLYTDGLVERVTEGIDEGMARLVAALTGSQGLSLDDLCDAALAQLPLSRRDDVAMLALRIKAGPA
jgi:GAF domain-containing protein